MKQHALCLNLLLITVGILVLLLGQRYGYGAYKLLVTGWWIPGLAVAAGLDVVLQRIPLTRNRACAFTLAVATLVLVSVPYRQGARLLGAMSSDLENNMKRMRIVRQVGDVAGRHGVLVAVDDPVASRWAVHFLRDARIHLGARRGILDAPHLRDTLSQARPVPLGDIGYVLTDDRDGSGLERDGRFRVAWSGGPYRLWDVRSGGWAVIVGVENTKGVYSNSGKRAIWLGNGETTLDVLTDRARSLELSADVEAGPTPGPYRIRVANDSGFGREVMVTQEQFILPMPAHPRRNRITLQVLEPVAPTVDDSRVLALVKPGVRPGDAGSDPRARPEDAGPRPTASGPDL